MLSIFVSCIGLVWSESMPKQPEDFTIVSARPSGKILLETTRTTHGKRVACSSPSKNHKLPPTTTRLECAFKRNELVKDSLLGTPALVVP